MTGKVFLKFSHFTLKSLPSGIFLTVSIHPGAVISFSCPPYSLKKKIIKKSLSKKFISPGIFCSTAPASVPISVKTSGPQALTGPKASGLDKRLVKASICCSVHGRDISRRYSTAILQFEETDSGYYSLLRVCKMFA